jgi:hypothetical protein
LGCDACRQKLTGGMIKYDSFEYFFINSNLQWMFAWLRMSIVMVKLQETGHYFWLIVDRESKNSFW